MGILRCEERPLLIEHWHLSSKAKTKTMINQLWTRFLFLALVCCILSCSEQQEGKVLKLAHGLDVKHPVHGGMVYLAQDLEKRSGGKLKIQIYPSGQLGSERQCLELLQIGSLDMTKVSAAPLENFSPKT